VLVVAIVIVVSNLVLFVELLVQTRQDDFLPQGAIEEPNENYVLDDCPAQLSHDVTWVSEDAPGFFPNRHGYFFVTVRCFHKWVHDITLNVIDNDCQYRVIDKNEGRTLLGAAFINASMS
jgi:hypothetical protein